jgi:hypothetical protein
MAMWFGSHETSGLGLNNSPHTNSPHMRTAQEAYPLGQDHEGIQSILNSTSCYDLMRNSSKVCCLIPDEGYICDHDLYFSLVLINLLCLHVCCMHFRLFYLKPQYHFNSHFTRYSNMVSTL